jgi:hypothetical protein
VDVADVIESLRQEHGMQWKLLRHWPGGGPGTHVAQTEHGTPIAFKWSEHPGALAEHSRRVQQLARLRDRGYPMPLHFAPIRLAAGAVVRPRQWIGRGGIDDRLSHRLLDDLLAVIPLQRQLLSTADAWPEFLLMTLTVGAGDWCRHDTLRQHSPASKRLLRRIYAVRDAAQVAGLPDTDLLHLDLHHQNVLQEGDRLIDLVTLAFSAGTAQGEPGVQQRLWQLVGDSVPPDALAIYLAHLSLRLVDWSVRRRPEATGYWLEAANRALDRHT